VAAVQYTFTHKEYTERHNTNNTQKNTKILEECGPCPVFTSYTLAFALQLRKKHGKTSVSVAEKYEYIDITIKRQITKINRNTTINTHCFSTTTMVAHTSASVLRYTHFARLVLT
jgi:hypothetical protein